MLGPGNLTTHLADLGADVIKVEPPQGDYGRRMTWPIVEGVSLLFLHISRGKKSIVLDLRTDAGRETFLELVRDADAVVEAMRPGGLDRRGLGFDDLRKVNPASCSARSPATARPARTATCRATASRTTRGPASWNRRSTPTVSCTCPSTCRSVSTRPDLRRARSARGVLRARESGEGCQIEIASPTPRPPSTGFATRRGARTNGPNPRSPATRPTTSNGARRAPAAWKPACATSTTRRATATCC